MAFEYKFEDIFSEYFTSLVDYFGGDKIPLFLLFQIPLIITKQHLLAVPDILLETQDEFCSSIKFEPDFIDDICYEGYLPMAMTVGESPLLLIKLHFQRALLYFNNLHIPKKIKKLSNKYELIVDNDFESCILNIINYHSNNWIVPPLKEAFQQLFYSNKHKTKFHSIELYRNNKLVAGEIGYSVGATYTSLSGFHLENNTGTIQLCATARLLEKNGFTYWDLGMDAEYKRHLGAQLVERNDFLELIHKNRDIKGVNLECDKTNAHNLIML